MCVFKTLKALRLSILMEYCIRIDTDMYVHSSFGTHQATQEMAHRSLTGIKRILLDNYS